MSATRELVRVRHVGVMRSLLMRPGLMVLCRFLMVMSGMLEVLGSLL